jgi:hypothetical protein
LSENAKRIFVQGRIGAANAAEFFGVLREIQAGTDVVRLLASRPGPETAALAAQDTGRALRHDLWTARRQYVDDRRLGRALEIIEQFPDIQGEVPLPIREAQTLAMELLMQKALETGLEATAWTARLTDAMSSNVESRRPYRVQSERRRLWLSPASHGSWTACRTRFQEMSFVFRIRL